jgi:hypothetical protein
VFHVRYELGFVIQEDGTLHTHSRENLKSYMAFTGWTLQTRNVFPVRYELGFCIPEDGILHSPRRENLKSYSIFTGYLGFRKLEKVVLNVVHHRHNLLEFPF